MPKLDLAPKYLFQIIDIIKHVAPDVVVWAYGSRINGNSHDTSDIDLVLRSDKHLNQPHTHTLRLKKAFQESNLPILIDIMDWALLPKSYQQEIEKNYVVIYPH